MGKNNWDWPFRRIGYIMVRCGDRGQPTLAIDSYQQIFDQPVDGVWASDHIDLSPTSQRGRHLTRPVADPTRWRWPR